MARPLKIEFAGALYHVTARGDRQEPIYEDEEDRGDFSAFWVRSWRGGDGSAMPTV